ncbi:MAG: carbohydrate ABC transporter substrate-binding protein, partial [Clostridia bacterium]|nr:carbohydrate ABC transporter substrate-binding protein [Clostridia bacterium]
YGDWAIVQGPQAHFWGGTWLLAPTGSDNPTMLADVMDTFINDEEVCSNLVEKEMQFSNNQAVNAKFAEDPEYGNAFLGGQNDTAVFVELAKNIKFENQTIYDQLLNEGLQTAMQEYYRGSVDEQTALNNYYNYVNETYPAIMTP